MLVRVAQHPNLIVCPVRRGVDRKDYLQTRLQKLFGYGVSNDLSIRVTSHLAEVFVTLWATVDVR